jgi:integrase
MPKVNRNGQAAVLSEEQLEEVFDYLPEPHDLIFQICYYTAARIGEVVQLQAEDIVGGYVVYRARTTKTKKTRSVAIAPPLARLLAEAELPKQGYLFSWAVQWPHYDSEPVTKHYGRRWTTWAFGVFPLTVSGDRC